MQFFLISVMLEFLSTAVGLIIFLFYNYHMRTVVQGMFVVLHLGAKDQNLT